MLIEKRNEMELYHLSYKLAGCSGIRYLLSRLSVLMTTYDCRELCHLTNTNTKLINITVMVGSSTPQQWLLQHYLKYADIVYLKLSHSTGSVLASGYTRARVCSIQDSNTIISSSPAFRVYKLAIGEK